MAGRTLLQPIPPLHTMIEKAAAAPIGNVPDDVEKWPAHVSSEMQRVFPFLGKYDVSINIDKTDAESGYGAGYAMVRNFSARNLPQAEVVSLQNYVRIPIIIQERKLQRPTSFELGGQFYALNRQRIGQAMSSNRIFDGSEDVSRARASTSILDDMFPPYQQRGGHGRIYDASSIGGQGKVASVDDMLKVAERARHIVADLRDMEKNAYGLTSAAKVGGGGYFGDPEWIRQFYQTPFFEEAQALLVKDAQSELEAAKQRAARAEGAIADALLDVEGAELSAKLASYKNKHGGVPENETLNKLSSCCYNQGTWVGEFAETPFFENALSYRAKCAAAEAKRAEADSDMEYDRRWREQRKGSTKLEAKLAAWKYEQATGKEFKAKAAGTSKEASAGGDLLRGTGIGAAAGAALGAGVAAGVAGKGNRTRGAFHGALRGSIHGAFGGLGAAAGDYHPGRVIGHGGLAALGATLGGVNAGMGVAQDAAERKKAGSRGDSAPTHGDYHWHPMLDGDGQHVGSVGIHHSKQPAFAALKTGAEQSDFIKAHTGSGHAIWAGPGMQSEDVDRALAGSGHRFPTASEKISSGVLRRAMGLEKDAMPGPLAEISGLGVPSAVGYIAGKNPSMTGEHSPEEADRKYSLLGGAFVPGYTGYHFGRKAGGRAARDAARAAGTEEKKASFGLLREAMGLGSGSTRA